MFIQRNTKKQGNNVYHSTLLVECYREEGKVRKRTLMNLSSWSEEDIAMLDKIIKGESLGALSEVEAKEGRSFGALWAIGAVAGELGITGALGQGKKASLVLFLAAARLIIQGSELAAARWAAGQATQEVLGIEGPSEDDLYAAMDWLIENQARLEDAIYAERRGKQKGKKGKAPTLFLYDVTSSSLEGDKNELAAYGYNRDGKRGKKQVVVGLLTGEDGFPVTVEVFCGSRRDTKTLASQLRKLKDRFRAERVVLVGDKGMIKSAQIKDICREGFSWITSISRPEIETLAQAGIIRLSLFDTELCEVEDGGVRYIMRRNPVRREEAKKSRRERLSKVLGQLEKEAASLASSRRKDPAKTYDRMVIMLDRLKVSKFVRLSLDRRELSFSLNEEELARAEALDGRYCIKTNLPRKVLRAKEVHDRYKDLARVESAFRALKTGLLEIRPLNHRKADRTRAHAFICTLALMVTHEMRRRLEGSGVPLEQVIRSLDQIQLVTLSLGKDSSRRIVSPGREQSAILDQLGLKLPRIIGESKGSKKPHVGTKMTVRIV